MNSVCHKIPFNSSPELEHKNTNLCDKYATLREPGLHDALIEGFGVEFITGASFYWVCQVADDHIEALSPTF